AQPDLQPARVLPPIPATSFEHIEHSLELIQEHESQVAKLHETYLSQQAEYARSFSQLVQLGFGPLANSSPDSAAFESLERSLARFHDHQQETLRLHAQYMQGQQEFSQNLFDLARQTASLDSPTTRTSASASRSTPEVHQPIASPAYTPPVSASEPVTLPPLPVPLSSNGNGHHPQTTVPFQETPAPASSLTTLESLSKALFEVVAEKTGYPVDMLESGMDMEADLGIDSIKRVEILGAMQALFPQLPKIGADALGELRTLDQIVAQLGASVPLATSSTVSTPVSASPVVQPVPAAPPTTSTSAKSTAELTRALLAIVSEKTGYPADMLETGMDMEADLGIDSIKRVEILGAMQTLFPDLPPASSTALAETRTLAQIIEMLNPPSVMEAPASGNETRLSPSPFDVDLPRSRVRIKPLPRPDAISLQIAPGSVCLLTDDGTPITPGLAQALMEQGWKVVVLIYPEHLVTARSELPHGIGRVQLKEASETSVKLLLDEVEKNHGQVGMFIHVNPYQPTPPGTLFSEAGKELSRLVFLAAKHLKEPLNRAVANGRSAFVTVARLDGAFGLEGNSNSDPSIGGLFGLVKSLNLEWDSVFCRAIDLSPELPVEQSVASILAEISDPNRLVAEVAYNSRGRFTLVIDAEETIEVI
ncbi:MAG: phosphopantetheine-binding protein, partial [Anaerolineaceae bacterium]|nr:phosphopantetheine-binding protein [Anaerolineaceae bacterium]